MMETASADESGESESRGTAGGAAANGGLVDQAIGAMMRLYRALHSEASTRWLDLDLTLTQVKAIFTLAHERNATVGELARALGIGNAGASILVDRLVRLGLAERADDPADRRRTIVRLSAGGEALVTELSQGRREQIHAVLAHLAPDDLRALAQGLSAAAAAAEALIAAGQEQE
jgi:DNA-binding MarR family transcriptional regulator